MQGQDQGQNDKYNCVSSSVPTEPSFLQTYFFLEVHVRIEGEGGEKKWPFLRTIVVIGSVKFEQWEEGGPKSKIFVNLIDVPLCVCLPFKITT